MYGFKTTARYSGMLVLTLALPGLALQAADEVFEQAKQKADRIVEDSTEPGETIVFSEAEANALMLGGLAEQGMEGVSEAKIDLDEDAGTWSGVVDFDKLPQLAPYKSNFLIGSILKGSAPVSASASLKSSGGQAVIDVTQVTIGETKFEGGTLGFLVKSLILSNHPELKLGEPFDLDHNVDSIKLSGDGITFRIKE